MFRNRRNSQKPNEEFYAAFKQSFPGLGPGSSAAGDHSAIRSTSLSDGLTDAPVNQSQRQFSDLEDLKEPDLTPKGLNDNWRFTPSLMDPNSFAFASFANQPPGYYTPTPGGVNTLYHSQAGDLHTPGMGMSIGTPLSLPHTSNAMHAHDPSLADLHHFQQQFMQSQPFQNLNPFGQQPQLQHQQSFHPSSFLQHQDSGYEAMDHSPPIKSPHNTDLLRSSQSSQAVQRLPHGSMTAPLPQMGEKFRYHVTLNAATAMIKHSDEIPVTYLNKGQAYTVAVMDTRPAVPPPFAVKYRTFVRVSFEDEQQRSKPAACWQLWKEGRGTNEAHQRGGKLLAVEYVDPNQGGDEGTRRPQVELESASFDGFCVTWSPNPVTGGPDCAIAVRFNFLSTDFSHSKGVKGIPVRLCAKTEMIVPEGVDPAYQRDPEVSYCKVKLFRDHGAERKLSNDVAHVKKTIDKLKQQIAQVESGMNNFGKRKRSGSTVKPPPMNRPGKVMKHKRTWSVDSDGEGPRTSAEDDLHMKLATMQDMFSSTRPASVLYLKGDPEDDPDEYPVQLSNDGSGVALTRTQTWESKQSPESTSVASNIVSPTLSTNSASSLRKSTERKPSGLQQTQAIFDTQSTQGSAHWSHPPSPEKPMKVQQRTGSGTATGWIDAIGVDSTYVPPQERSVKPVACFYVALQQPGSSRSNDLYRAIYLMQRSVKDLTDSIAHKCHIDPSRISRTIRLNPQGIRIVVDDEVVNELPEGQAMLIEVHEISDQLPVKNEADELSTSDFLVDSELEPVTKETTTGLEMRLIY